MKNSLRTIIHMFKFTKNVRVTYIVGIIFFTSQIFTANLVQAFFLNRLSDGVINGDINDILASVGLCSILFLVQIIFTLFGIVLYNLANIKIERKLKTSLFKQYLEISKVDNQFHTSQAISSMNYDVDSAINCLGNGFALLCFSLFTIIGSLIVIAVIDMRVFVIELIIGIVAVIIQLRNVKPVESLSDKIMKYNQSSVEVITNLLRGIDTVQSNLLDKLFRSNYGKEVVNIYTAKRRLIWIHSFQSVYQSLFRLLSFVGIFGFGLYLVSVDELTFSVFIMLPTLCIGITEAMSSIGRQWTNLHGPIAAAKRVLDIYSIKKETSDKGIVENRFTSEIALSNIGCKYGEHMVFSGVNHTFKAGDVIVISGKSGSGKSSLLKMLIGIQEVSVGNIVMDGVRQDDYSKKSWKNNFAYVDQECRMFHMSIRDNIKVGRLSAHDDEIVRMARRTQCHGFVKKLRHGYDTIIGENQTGLSQGESQRVAIARALLREAPILVMDEFTSALDPQTEKEILDMLFNLKGNRTLIISTHNDEVINKADSCIQL